MKMLEEKEFFEALEEALETTEGDVFSIRIVKEDDDTFDIRIWDEREVESCEDIEEGYFGSYEAALKRLEEIITENSEVVFLRMQDEL